MPTNSTATLLKARIRNSHIIRTKTRISKGGDACPDWNTQWKGESQQWHRRVAQLCYFCVLVTDLLACRNASTLLLSTIHDPVSTNAGMGAKLAFDPSTAMVLSLC